MAASEGVDLEWCIVDEVNIRLGKLTKYSKSYQSKIETQGKKCADHIMKRAGNQKLEIWHSDDQTNPTGKAIFANPEPKTDIIVKIGSRIYYVSVKMQGAVQLASGQGEQTAVLFESAANSLQNKKKSKVLSSIITELRTMPTRMLSTSNKSRILSEGKDKVISEFIKDGKIITDKHYDAWLTHNKPELMEKLLTYINNDKEFLKALLYESMTGELSLKQYKGAPANQIVSPAGFYDIDQSYIDKIIPKVKFDIRGKSRSGITGVAFRIDLKS